MTGCRAEVCGGVTGWLAGCEAEKVRGPCGYRPGGRVENTITP